ncbi:MAG: hypothetical protein GY854_24765 [Deltaproteobacteria bacterium]|nr:hypothetical protein [Deltaproteobacteria bacterium]
MIKASRSITGGLSYSINARNGLTERIVRLLPPHRVYVEPFTGDGAVLFMKEPAETSVVNAIASEPSEAHRIINQLDGKLYRYLYPSQKHHCRRAPRSKDRLEGDQEDELDSYLRQAQRVRRLFNRTSSKRR